MRQIKDMLTKESTEAEVLNKKIEKIFQVIEDLRNSIMKKTMILHKKVWCRFNKLLLWSMKLEPIIIR